MTELVETEEEYVKKLGHVCEVGYDISRIIITMWTFHWQNYIGEIEMLEGLPGGLVGKKNILFSNIEMLYGFNKE